LFAVVIPLRASFASALSRVNPSAPAVAGRQIARTSGVAAKEGGNSFEIVVCGVRVGKETHCPKEENCQHDRSVPKFPSAHHMTHEEPRFLFIHYWGKGKAESLARSLKKTLDTQNSVK
jgi:hypothetical protein